MTATVFSATNIGFEGKLIEVECDTSNGLPGLQIVGLGNKAIDEARERVRSAIKNCNLEFPKKRITVNLAPANLPKHGAHFDLPIAIALLAVSGQIPAAALGRTLVVGELALDGTLRPIAGAIGHTEVAKQNGMETIILPASNAPQAMLVQGITVLPAKSLREVSKHLTGSVLLQQVSKTQKAVRLRSKDIISLDEIQGQEQAKRALVIAAAGRHNILLSGPPGAGKTMLARALPSLLPPLAPDEIIETTKIHSLAGKSYERIISDRPFRAPHHSASHVALTGGGAIPRPGEISLAHHGILFLDELPEYSRQALESLRQPLEDKRITIARANDSVSFPADFMLVATQNPCPCGFSGDPHQHCTCSPHQLQRYQKKISGPLLDRIDMVVEVSRVEPIKLLQEPSSSGRASILTATISNAISIQCQRSKNHKTNASLSSEQVRQLARLDPAAKQLLDRAASLFNLSARSYFKVIKVARTIADLGTSEYIEPAHMSEALQYRMRK